MSSINRRQWMRKSLLASSGILLASQSEVIAKATAGIPADHPLLRLNWNENPYGPSKKAIFAVTDALQEANRYPDSKVGALKSLIGSLNGLSKKEVLITAGSTEILSLLGQHVGLAKGEIITPWPTFPTIVRFGEVCGAQINKVALDANQVIDFEAIKDAISGETKLIFICNPNNPTSTEVDNDDLISFLRSVDPSILLCVDEAYVEYSKMGLAGSMAKLVPELPNLIVSRTFSKAHGLAGLRIGYALSQESNIAALSKRHLGHEISAGVAPISAALASLNDPEFVNTCVSKNRQGLQVLYDAFDKWNISYNKSSTNFVYAKSKRFDKDLVAKLKADNILITQWDGIMDGHIRISIGAPRDMHTFVNSAEQYLL